MENTSVDDMLIEMIQPKIKEIEEKFSKGEGLAQEDINTLLLKSQYNHINHLDNKLNEVTASVVSLEGKFETLEGKFETLRTELKGDMNTLKSELKGDMNSLKSELKGDMNTLRSNIKVEIKEAINSNMRWSIGMITFIVVGLKLIDMIFK